MKNMKIKDVFIISCVLLSASVITLVVSVWNITASQRELNDIEENRVIAMLLADELKEISRELTSAVRRFVVSGDSESLDEYYAVLGIRSGGVPRPDSRDVAPGEPIALMDLMRRETDYSDAELNILQTIIARSDALALVETEAINAMLGRFPDGSGYTAAGEPNEARAVELIFSPAYAEAVDAIMEPFAELRSELSARTERLISEAQKSNSLSLVVMESIFGVMAVVLIADMLMISLLIVRPVTALTQYAESIASGDLGSVLSYKSENEIGTLANSLRYMLQVLHERIDTRENMARFVALISNSDAGIVITDKNGNITDWSAGAEGMLGFTRAELIGKTLHYCTPEEEHKRIDEVHSVLKNGEHITSLDTIRLHRDGHHVNCACSWTPVFDDDREFSGSVAVFHDVTEKKQMERALEEAAHQALEASRAKAAFLANMRHEIRTPLNGVIGFAELAMDDDGVSDSTKDFLTKIKSSADGLLEIVNDILDISKVEAGRMELEHIPFDLPEILAKCRIIVEPKALEKNIDIYFYSEPVANGRLAGDPTKLRQAILNLLSNAVKFTNHGIVKLTAVAEDSGEDGKTAVRFEVMDSGIGMDEAQLARIFEPFSQADSSTTRKYGGTGLGLSLTKSLVELMGGELKVESQPGLGSRFYFTLLFDAVAAGDDAAATEAPTILKKPAFKGEVLVCEDNRTNQEVIVNHLLRVGLSPTVAVNGMEGLTLAVERLSRGSPFDLVFMDVHMPVMDGIESAHRMLKAGVTQPIIALTANALSTDHEKYISSGMADYLSKPFTSQELWGCLLRHLTPVGQSSALPEPAEPPAAGGLIANDVLDEALGIERGVIVQATTYGLDHSIVLDGLAAAGPNYRGCAIAMVLAEKNNDAYITKLHDAGVRGGRFNFVPQLNMMPSQQEFSRVIDRMRELGWYAKIQAPMTGIMDSLPLWRDIEEVPVVIDHMARYPLEDGLNGPYMRTVLELLKRDNFWILLSNGCLNIEHLINLEQVVGREFFTCAFPLRLEGMEGSPTRVVAFL